MKRHGLAHPVFPLFAGCYRKSAEQPKSRPLTDEQRENARAALVLDMMDRAGVFDDGQTALEHSND